jgi:hypothetical protein
VIHNDTRSTKCQKHLLNLGIICLKLIVGHSANLMENLTYPIPNPVPAEFCTICLKLIVCHVANMVAKLGHHIPK